ncbi:YafY family protein [Nonomuraea sp. NPDC005692]|uniref:helix-turn-helix transcriptional regulator n=1 Tax=Nonomuraea sp. NPDC005692 TaxID=3157168 RepID=UPI0033DCDA47
MSILLMLQTRRRVTAQELADVFEVSVRTVYRDMDALSAAGVPLYGEPGHDGGYRLLGGFLVRLNGLTEGEAESLFLTGLPGAAADLGLGAIVTAAELKLMSALPTELRDRAERFAERFHLDAPPWYGEEDRTPYLTAVADAVWGERVVRMRYFRWAEPHEVTRAVEPLGLVLKAGHWYLVARSEGRIRPYRISRILDLQVLEEQFARPRRFALAEYWQTYLESFDERRHQDTATIRLSPDALASLPDLMDRAVVQAARDTATAADSDGWIQVTIPIESIDRAVASILRLGADVEVLAPADLRERLTDTLTAMTRIYDI